MIYGNMKEHKYEAEGIKPQIMTEVTTLLHTLYEQGMFTKEDIHKMADLACMSEKEVHDKATEILSEQSQSTSKMMEKIFEDAKNGKQEAIDALNILTDMMLDDLRGNK